MTVFSMMAAGIVGWTNLTNRMSLVEGSQLKQKGEISALSQNVSNIAIKLGTPYVVPAER
jgi:hypothetical protein